MTGETGRKAGGAAKANHIGYLRYGCHPALQQTMRVLEAHNTNEFAGGLTNEAFKLAMQLGTAKPHINSKLICTVAFLIEVAFNRLAYPGYKVLLNRGQRNGIIKPQIAAAVMLPQLLAHANEVFNNGKQFPLIKGLGQVGICPRFNALYPAIKSRLRGKYYNGDMAGSFILFKRFAYLITAYPGHH